MRSQLFILFVLLNVIFQATTACTQQPDVNTDTTNTDITTNQLLIKKDLSQPRSTIKADVPPVQLPDKQVSLKAGTYNVGSRYITIANQGSRICYQGVSMPSGRYAVAVGETTGSLSAENDYFVADGWKKYGRTITLSQNGENLSISSLDGVSPSGYNFFQKDSGEKYSESLTNCLNGTGEFFETAPSYTISTSTGSQTKQVTGNLLSPEQTAKFLQLPIPVVAPTFLPEGFRLVQAKGEANKYVNGDDDSGYSIDYQGANNTCISIRSSSSGSRGLKKVNQVQTEFGSVAVYTENRGNSRSIVSFLPLRKNPILISVGSIPDPSADGGFKGCEPMEMEVYIQVLKSLTLVK